MKASFYTLGCKVNQYETEIMEDRFKLENIEIVRFGEQADIVVINSCTVTGTGDKKTKQLIRRIRRELPNCIIALTGCFPQAFPEQAEAVKEADVIIGASNRKDLIDCVKKAIETKKRVVHIKPHERNEEFEPMKAEGFLDRTRACVKIEDGCDRYCTYCIIPKARGFVRSKPLLDVYEEVKELAKNNYKEIVLVGINLSSYGKEIKYKEKLVDVVEKISTIEGVERIRLGSLEPDLLSQEDIIRLSKIEKFCPHFHLSLQSGCDETLKRMNRHYTTNEYREVVNRIREYFKDAAITTDVMVGFAGETKDEFLKSLSFVKEMSFMKAHVFPYSIREGTKAAEFDNQVSKHDKEKRSEVMIEQSNLSENKFLKEQIGKEYTVLFEKSYSDKRSLGHTKNYMKVNVISDQKLEKEIKKVKIVAVKGDECVGELID